MSGAPDKTMRGFLLNFFLKWLVRDGRLVELQNSVASMAVGLVFIANSWFEGELYLRYAQIYEPMSFLPTVAWGGIFFVAGLVHLLSVALKWQWWRKQILLVKGGLWLFLGLIVLQGEPYATSGYCYIIFAVSAALAYLSIQLSKDGAMPI